LPNKFRRPANHSTEILLADHSLSFWISHFGLPFICGLLLAFVYPMTQLDLTLIAPYYSAEIQDFPLRKHWFMADFMHLTLKYVMIFIALLMLTGVLYSLLKPALKSYRRRLAWIFTGLILSPAVIYIIKRQSNLSCPRDLTIFGGDLPRLELLPAGFLIRYQLE